MPQNNSKVETRQQQRRGLRNVCLLHGYPNLELQVVVGHKLAG